MSLAGDDLSQSVMIAVYIPARNAASVESERTRVTDDGNRWAHR